MMRDNGQTNSKKCLLSVNPSQVHASPPTPTESATMEQPHRTTSIIIIHGAWRREAAKQHTEQNQPTDQRINIIDTIQSIIMVKSQLILRSVVATVVAAAAYLVVLEDALDDGGDDAIEELELVRKSVVKLVEQQTRFIQERNAMANAMRQSLVNLMEQQARFIQDRTDMMANANAVVERATKKRARIQDIPSEIAVAKRKLSFDDISHMT